MDGLIGSFWVGFAVGYAVGLTREIALLTAQANTNAIVLNATRHRMIQHGYDEEFVEMLNNMSEDDEDS